MGGLSNGIVYSTEEKEKKKEKKSGGDSTKNNITKILADSMKETIEKLEKIHIYGIGYPEWMELWEQARQIDPVLGAKKYPVQAKRVNENIIAEYLRAIQEKPKIIENDPQTLLEVMNYASESYTQHTLDIATCRKIRIFFNRSYKHLTENKKTDNKKMIEKYKNTREKTKYMTVD